MALLQAPQWTQVCVSDWTLAEFACALQAKVWRGDTPAGVAREITQLLARLLAQNALQRIAVLREDYRAVELQAAQITGVLRGADALHLAVAARHQVSHFATFDKTQLAAARHWLPDVACVPGGEL